MQPERRKGSPKGGSSCELLHVLEYLDAAVGFSYIQESTVGAAVFAAVDAAVSLSRGLAR